MKKLSWGLLLVFYMSLQSWAQVPTSFTYPTPVVYIANVSNVFLSPNVAGSVSTYSMPASPALPTGLSFNPNTGVISGVPTAALNQTVFTVTATNPSGSASTNFTLTVTSNYLNNNNNQVHFGGTGVIVTHPNGTSAGTSAGDITLYQNVSTISGQAIDCIITTKTVTNVNPWVAYDQNEATGNGFNSNSPDYFSPQVTFGAGGGSIAYDFQFILAGTYNSNTKTGTNVVLQNVKLNTYDIDGNGNDNTNQFNEFGGFNTSELGKSPTIAATYNATTGLTKFRSTSKENSTVITADATRVRVAYTNMSSFSIVVGSEGPGLAYFFLDFSSGPTFSSDVSTAPSLDLNTAVVGVANEQAGCGTSLIFTKSGQTNVAAEDPLKELDVTYLLSDLKNGAGEKLIVNGATAGTSSYDLNFTTAGSATTVTIGGITFVVTKSVSTVSGITTNKIAFTRTSGGTTFTVAQSETLLDALQYTNTATAPTAGDRKFTVNVLDGTFKSPDAVFTADVNCVSISGNIWRDQNGLLGTTDFNTVSANSTAGQFAANFAYAILVNPANNQVIASQGISAGGAFTFGTVTPGSYILYVSKNTQTAGTSFTKATLPDGGYVFIGENLGSGAGNDLLVDGKLAITVGSVAVTDANFGLDIAPVALDATAATQTNPGGTQKATVPTLHGTDPEQGTLSGSGNTVKITSLPSNGTLYYNGIAVNLSAVISNYNPALLTVDPNDGALTVTFKYQEVDAAGLTSPDANVTMPFTDFSISGKVYHDANGTTNSLIDGTLISNPGGSSPLYANLVINGQVAGSVAVTGGAYSFATANGLQTNTSTTIVISTVQGVVGTTTGATSTLPAGWLNTADGITTGDGTPNGLFTINVVTSNITTGLDFGIEVKPIADPKSYNISQSAFSSTLPTGYPNQNTASVQYLTIATSSSALTAGALSGSDFEDCTAAGTCSTGKSFQIATVNSNTKLFYDFGQGNGGIKAVTAGTTIPNYDPAKLIIYAQKGSGIAGSPFGFTYSLIDVAGKISDPVTYSIITGPLPVTLISFAGNREGSIVQLSWSTAQEVNSEKFDVQHSSDARSWQTIGSVAAFGDTKVKQNYTFTHATPSVSTNYYRLNMVDRDATFAYSRILNIDLGSEVITKLYPNPVSDKLTIEASNWSSVTSIELVNTNGASVLKTIGSNLNNQVDIKSLSAGTYILKLGIKDGSFVARKVLITK